MADTKISAEPAAAALTGAELIPGVQAGGNVKLTAAQIAALARATLHPGYVAGRWYVPREASNVTSNSPTANRLALYPVSLAQPVTISQLGARIVTAAAGGNIALAIYAADATTKLPTGTPLGSVAGLSTGTAAVVSGALAAPAALAAGLYWFASNADNASVVLTVLGLAGGASGVGGEIGAATLAAAINSATGVATSRAYTQAYGAFPDLTSAATFETSATPTLVAFLGA